MDLLVGLSFGVSSAVALTVAMLAGLMLAVVACVVGRWARRRGSLRPRPGAPAALITLGLPLLITACGGAEKSGY